MQVMHDDDNNITICTALYQSFGFFIIMSPAEGLHFSALVMYVGLSLYRDNYSNGADKEVIFGMLKGPGPL